MHARARQFVTVLAALAVVALVVETVRSVALVGRAPVEAAVVTVAVALLLFSPVTVGRRERATHMTFGETAAVLAFAALPPAPAALACSVAALVLVLSLSTSTINRVFNAASAVTAAAAGALVAAALQAHDVPVLLAAAAAALVFGAVSHLQVVVVLSLDRGSPIPGIGAGLRQLVLVEGAGAALGVLLAPLLVGDPSGGWRVLPLLLVLAVLSRRQSQLGAERDLLDELAGATQDLHVSLRHDEVLEALHAHASRLLPRSAVTLQQSPPDPGHVGVPVGGDGLWLVARSGVAQVGVPTEQRVLEGLSTAAHRALENARLHRQVEEQARTDALTGLPNRLALVQRLDQELARVRRQGGHVGLAFLDLDGFKRVNDEHGHEAGDALLVELARHLRAATRAEDLVARLAGDEFCVVLVGVDDRAACAQAAEDLRLAVERDLGTTRVGVSLGFAFGPDDGDDVSALLHAADLAMYADKSARPRSRVLPERSRD